jgi:aryl-alcohol dehydrogenase
MNRPIQARAAVVRQRGGPFQIEGITLEEPRAHEVLVRIVAVGMCHTDIVCRDQLIPIPLPVIFGHEGAGVVEHIGANVKKVAPGDHVVLSFMSCGTCDACQCGHPSYCRDFATLNFGGGRLDGSCAAHAQDETLHDHFFGQSSFSTYALAYERNVVKVRKDVPLELLGPLGCGIQTGAGAVINSLRVGAGQSFAAFGAGAVGLGAVMAAQMAGASTIIAIDIKPNRLQLALEVGATHVVNSAQEDAVTVVQRITSGKGVNFSLESTALPSVLRQAIAALDIMGVCGVVGVPVAGTEGIFDWNGLMATGKIVRGIVEGDSIPDLFIPQLINLYAQGRFPFDKLVKFYTLEEINQAAADSEQGGTIKPIIRM